MKNNYLIALIGVFFLSCIIYVAVNYKTPNYKYLNAPKIRKELRLDEINVKKMAFDRNGLYINGIQYNVNDISGYSEVHSKDSVIKLDEIKPPFTISKKENSDTLEIIKVGKKYFVILPKGKRNNEIDE